MPAPRAKAEVGFEVYKIQDSDKRGYIIAVDTGGYVTVEWEDGTRSDIHIYRLGDVSVKRRAAQNAIANWVRPTKHP